MAVPMYEQPHTITLDLDDELRKEIRCVICMDIPINSHTSEKCIHRLCHECWLRNMKEERKECPLCRAVLPTKRHLRANDHFDKLMRVMFPNRATFDEEDLNTSAYALIAKQRVQHMVAMTPQQRLSTMDLYATPQTQARTLIRLRLDVHPASQFACITRRHLKVGLQCMVQHVCNYIAIAIQTNEVPAKMKKMLVPDYPDLEDDVILFHNDQRLLGHQLLAELGEDQDVLRLSYLLAEDLPQ